VHPQASPEAPDGSEDLCEFRPILEQLRELIDDDEQRGHLPRKRLVEFHCGGHACRSQPFLPPVHFT